ncbi:MAG: 6-phosphogluconolactonase [Bacteroidota bacterium]
MNPVVHIYPSKTEAASAFAQTLSEQIAAKEGHFHLALSGGSTPKLLFTLLAENYRNEIPWGKVHLWWGDERCVPPEHEESNYRMTKEFLLFSINIPQGNIHRVRGEDRPDREAIRYEEEIKAHLESKDGWPVFDMIMLGMGGDGHTASIFPDNLSLLDSPQTCAVAIHPDSGQKRVTLTGKVINQAKEVAFLVTGASKKEKVQAILGKEEGSKAYPAAHIQPVEGNLSWYLDEAAAP